eukprot:1155916-Pelagomonas_calceolata.AAC.12
MAASLAVPLADERTATLVLRNWWSWLGTPKILYIVCTGMECPRKGASTALRMPAVCNKHHVSAQAKGIDGC